MQIGDYILQETKSWLVINKPAGLIVEASPFEASTVETLLQNYLFKTPKPPFVGIVHRLDRVTSGALLVAKKKSTLKALNTQFEQRQIEKIYLAVVAQSPDRVEGELQHWLVKNQKEKRSNIYEKQVTGSTLCHLSYRVISQQSNHFLLEIKPTTGKFHQIRAQFSFIGCPIVGDEKYGSTQSYLPKSIALHAWKLGFLDPEDGQKIQVTAEVPSHSIW